MKKHRLLDEDRTNSLMMTSPQPKKIAINATYDNQLSGYLD